MPTKKKSSAMKKTKKSASKARGAISARSRGQIKNHPKKIETKKHRSLLGIQLVIAGSAITVLLFLGVIQQSIFATNRSSAAEITPVTIGIEHQTPIKLSVVFARKDTAGYVALQNNSDETIHLSLPSSWHRTEVMGASIADITSEIPVFGFVRWKIPAHSGMRMLLPSAPSRVFFDSRSEAIASIEMQMIDLKTLSSTKRVTLIQKEGATVNLWNDEE